MIVANALFADGAAAVVGRSANGRSKEWRIGGMGTFLVPQSADEMTWRIGDHGFRMTLSARVPELIESHLKDWMVRWLAEHDLALDDVGSWAVHPGGPRVLRSVERSLGVHRDRSGVAREVLAECGNMSSATILFILDRLKRLDTPRPCVALAFGPGLVVETLLIT
jgi:predicted naringenin-chalcone synthase